MLLERAAWAWRRKVDDAAAQQPHDPLLPPLREDAEAVRFLIRISKQGVGQFECSDED